MRDLHTILRRGIQFLVDFGAVAILLAADRADLDLQHGVRLDGLVEQFLGDVEVFGERHGGTVPHVRLEGRFLAVRDLVDLVREQRAHPFVEVLLGAVVGVERDGDVRVLLRNLVRERGERQRSGDAVVHALAGEVGGTADGHLDDAVGFGFGEALQGGVQGLRTRHVDGGVRVAAATGGVEHFSITFGSCDSHTAIIAPSCG